KGAYFSGVSNVALAPKAVRAAAKVNADQGEVWENVRREKVKANVAFYAEINNSSLNETLEAPKVKKASDEFAAALESAVAGHPTAVGVAIAVNGKLEEFNVYPNHRLLTKLYPRLIRSYALQAILESDKAKDAPALSGGDVVKFMTEGKEKH